ncbi:MAG: hypothetical protein ACI97A_001596 [Planctomycetota bacterium]|jgi:hypothetical protein
MRSISWTLTFFLLFASTLAAQDLPYVQKNPDEFLKTARQQQRPSVVIFNFNLSSG